MRYLLLLLIFLCTACDEPSPQTLWQTLPCRDSASREREPTYRIRVPTEWLRSDPDEKESISDSRLPNATFRASNHLEITFHTFPQPIPPNAQIARWQKQFTQAEEGAQSVSAQSFGGFIGLRYEAYGHRNGEPWAVLAWAMELSPAYMRQLTYHPEAERLCANYTVKASGSPEAISENREKLEQCVRSIQLIPILPSPL